MRFKNRAVLLVGAVATAAALAACGSSGGSSAAASSPAAAPTAASSSAAAGSGGTTALQVGSSGNLGQIVTDQNGFALYLFEKDSTSPSTSNCVGQCAVTWPPVTGDPSTVQVTGINRSLIGSITRADGSTQLTLDGHPLYRFAKDTAPGQTNGEGVSSTWFVISPSGQQAASGAGGADLNTASNSALGTIVTDEDGYTLYVFGKDTPGHSNCAGQCAVTWPPAVVQSATGITVNGISQSAVGTITRADGSLQLTIDGSPVYEFSKDTQPGQINGQGVEGIWFAVSPNGQPNKTKVTSAGASGSPSAAGGGSGY